MSWREIYSLAMTQIHVSIGQAQVFHVKHLSWQYGALLEHAFHVKHPSSRLSPGVGRTSAASQLNMESIRSNVGAPQDYR